MSKSSIKKNFSYQMIYEITILILPFVTSPYLARVIGADGVGTYTYTYTMANYFVLCAMLGIKNYGNRLVARNREDPKHLNEIFSSLLFLHIIVSLICFAAYIVYAFFIAENRSYELVLFWNREIQTDSRTKHNDQNCQCNMHLCICKR